MPGTPVKLGPFEGGLHDSTGTGEFIEDEEVYVLENLEVDIDKSLVNRPAIKTWTNGTGSPAGIRVIGIYQPDTGVQYLVVCWGTTTRLVNAATGAFFGGTATVKSICVQQYFNKLWVIPQPGSVGGNFDSAGTYTAVSAIPKGDAVVMYRDRMVIACGISATTDSSRLFFSAEKDPTNWSTLGAGNADIEVGNGEKLVSLVNLNNDLVLFKEHSTYRFTYTRTPATAELSKINSTIGCPGPNCVVVYSSNNIYVLHDNSVYELYNYSYTRISQNIAMKQTPDLSLYALDTYALSLFRERLIVRYYDNVYVYSLRTAMWSRWTSGKKIGHVITVPSSSLGLDIAYASSASSDNPGKIYTFKDDRVDGVGSDEIFNCRIITKTYDFDVAHSYKRMFWWGLTIATSGDTFVQTAVPGSTTNITWAEAKETRTWDEAKLGFTWADASRLLYPKDVMPAMGAYARKFIKLPKGLRFRQITFEVETEAKANTVGADASVRIYDLTIFVQERETVVRETT